jgi:DNA-binding XRE family transcriptional regulator
LLLHRDLVFDDGLVTKPIGADVKRKSKTPNEVFGRAVTEMRTARSLSQATLADSLGYSTYYLGRIERGLANTSCDVMAAVSNYFDMSIGEFWTYAEKLPKNQSLKK